jgi:hypothetical protein
VTCSNRGFAPNCTATLEVESIDFRQAPVFMDRADARRAGPGAAQMGGAF